MACFSLAWIQQVLIYAVIVCAVIALLKLVIPFILAQLGSGGGIISQAINILFWAIICIFVIYVVFAIIGCLLSMSGGGLSLMPHR
jgi:hypothetical protein